MYKKRWFALSLMIVFLMSCASAVPIPPDKTVHPPKTVPVIKEKETADRSTSDTDLFHDAVSYLDNLEVTANYLRAKSAFELLIKNYPKSKWRNLSETFIRIIDNIQAYKAKSGSARLLADKAHADNGRVLQENEQLKKENEQLTKENEQLKKDLQLLKNLEIQLEKRERTLR